MGIFKCQLNRKLTVFSKSEWHNWQLTTITNNIPLITNIAQPLLKLHHTSCARKTIVPWFCTYTLALCPQHYCMCVCMSYACICVCASPLHIHTFMSFHPFPNMTAHCCSQCSTPTFSQPYFYII